MSNIWWGEKRVALNTVGKWRIGPLKLYAERRRNEWRIGREPKELFDDDSYSFEIVESIPSKAEVERFVFSTTADQILLTPYLAKKPIITRPVSPVNLPPKETVVFFAGAPVWVNIAVGNSPISLTTIPIARPSDTWFGPDTLEGELCYAIRTAARIRIEELPFIPWHAITPLSITNLDDKILTLDRIKMPIPNLTCYESNDSFLWTSKVKVDRKNNAASVSVTIDDSPPAEAGEITLLSHPRIQPMGDGVTRTLSSFFS